MTLTINPYDQEIEHNHVRSCWDDQFGQWWFDNGEPCTHPEWHV